MKSSVQIIHTVTGRRMFILLEDVGECGGVRRREKRVSWWAAGVGRTGSLNSLLEFFFIVKNKYGLID